MHKKKRNFKKNNASASQPGSFYPSTWPTREAGGKNKSAIKNGVFDVDIDGKVVYSKHTTERFPKSWRTFNTVLNLN